MLNGFAKSIIPFAIYAHENMRKGETSNVESIPNLEINLLLKNSIILKDHTNKIWFSTTNPDIVKYITEAYFGKYNEILRNWKKSSTKEEIMDLTTTLPRTTAYRKICELIKFGLIIQDSQTRTKNENNTAKNHTPTFCKLFDKLEYVESTNSTDLKFCINRNILKKNFWRNNSNV